MLEEPDEAVLPDEEEPELPEDLDPACLTSLPTTERVRVPLAAEEMEAVRLILWTVTDNMEA